MMRSGANAAVSVERFFQFSLWGLLTCGYLAVAGSGYLDAPTVALTGAGLVLRALLIAGVLRLAISERLVIAATLAYIGFFPLDYLFLSRGFLESTVHLVFFLAVVKILTANSNRDYLYTAMIAFLELLAAAILSIGLSFFLFLALYLLFAMAAFTSSEIRRSLQKPQTVARGGLRHFHSRLAALSACITLGILLLTAGLFFMLPRTAGAAFDRLFAQHFYLPGFSNQVTLGEIGEVKSSSRPVMHVRLDARDLLPNLKWRGAALSEFDGRKWVNPPSKPQIIPVERGQVVLNWRDGQHISYRVDLNAIDTDVLFFAGLPDVIESLRHPLLLRTATDSYRLGHAPPQGFHYEAYSVLEESTPPAARTGARDLSAPDRRIYLQLPKLDPRIPDLARVWTQGQASDANRARALERHLRSDFGYTLELPAQEVSDPLAYFLFERKKGHCEYFASAMAVMLRTLGIPARLATGFQSGTFNPLTELYVIRASDAHSWVEAWLPDRGWTTFDPTPPDPNLRAASLWKKLSLYADAAETFWRDWVLSYDLGRQATLADRMGQGTRSLGRWFEHLNDSAAVWKARVQFWLEHYALWSLLAAALAAAAVWFGPKVWRLWRTRRGVRRLRHGQASMADATLLYSRMLELLRRRGYQKPAWFTPNEFSRSLPPSELALLVRQFTAAYNALRFGGHRAAAPQLSILLDKLESQ